MDSVAGDLQYNVVVQTQNGKLTNCFQSRGNRECTYTPSAGYVGADRFEFSITDKENNSSLVNGVVEIEVNAEVLSAVEQFTQGAASAYDGVDFTWVVDDSGSMSGEQADLATNFDSLADNMGDEN